MNRATTAKFDDRSRAQRRRSAGVPINTHRRRDPLWFSAVFGCAFLLRLIYLVQIRSIPLFTHLAGDGYTYDAWAQRIAAGDWLGQGVFYQAPLYPYFLGLLQTFFGHDLWLIRLVQITIGSASCALIYLVARHLFCRRAGIAAGLILACYAPAIFFDALIEKSILDLFLLSLLLWLMIRAIERKRGSEWVGMGVLLGLLGLSRENALILTFVIPLWIAFNFAGVSAGTRLRWVGLFLAGVLVVLAPVGLRNFAVGGEFALTTSQFGPNFFIGNGPTADGTYGSVRKFIGEPQLEGNDAKRLAERAMGRNLMPGEVSGYWFQQSWRFITSQPWPWLKLLAKKWLLVWNAREIEDSDDFYIYQQWSGVLRLLAWINHFGILAPLAGAGLWLTRSRWRQLWVLYAMLLALASSVAIFYVFGRYRFPLVPFLSLFAGAGLAQMAAHYRQGARAPLLSGVAVFAAIALIVNWPIYGISGPGPGGYNNLANAYYANGKVEEAIATARNAIQVQPDYGVAHYNLGNLYASQGRFDLARGHFEEALKLYPNYADARINLGQLIAERGDLEGGIEQFRKAIEINPSLSRAHLNLGIALAKVGRLDQAVPPLREAARLLPRSAEARTYLGTVYAAQGRLDEAAESFNDALRVQADFAAAHQRLGELLSLQGKKEEALRHYREARRLIKQTESGARRPSAGLP
jgi:tetratricopeptide (TPR) repeat protein